MSNQEILFINNDKLVFENPSLRSQVETKDILIKNYEEELSRLNEMYRDLQRSKFGKKSERWESTEQLLFNEAELESLRPDPLGDKDEVEIKVSAHTKKVRGHRRALPADLEREEIIVELPESERFAEDGTPLKVIGYEVSEKLSYQPSKTKVIVYRI